LVTIGVYGWDEERFFRALTAAQVDTFCDLRRRRGVRGAEYAFANSQRLQTRLAGLGIRYVYCQELAPSLATRAEQYAADEATKTAKRQRTTLSPSFVTAYRQQCLTDFDSARFAEGLGPQARVVALFCVEQEPAACHRSLVAERLARDLNLKLVNLVP
jgi:hypothetical protein